MTIIHANVDPASITRSKERGVPMSTITRRNFVGMSGIAGIAAAAGFMGVATGCTQEAVAEQSGFKPGTYRAAAQGMAGYVYLSTTFDESSIIDIEILDENQSVGICEEVYATIPANVIDTQSLGVDVVSGATLTSYAVIDAIADCVSQAGGDADAMRKVKIPVEVQDEEFSYDVVVVGAGLAGLCTAIEAAREGAHVALVEKQGVLGTAVFSSGITYIAPTPDDVEAMYAKWIENAVTTCEYPTVERVRDLCEASPEVMEFLVDVGFEYSVGLNGNLMPTASTGMLRNNIPIRLGSKEPLAKGGEALMRGLEAACAANGVDVFMNTGVTKFILEGDAMAGVVCETPRGVKTYRASSVVLCSGDYGRNPEMVKTYSPESIHDITSTGAGNTGTCMELAIEAGAAVYESQQPMSGSLAFEPENKPVCGQPFDQFPFECMLVDYHGERKVREDAPNNHVQHQYFMDPDRPCAGWAIMDEAVARKVWVMDELLLKTEKGDSKIRAYKADTIEELAKLIEVDANTLASQLDAYNALCESGEDTAFGKEASFLTPMKEGPYYGVLAYSIIRAIAGGVKTNGDFEVIRADGQPIPGLYAAGISSSREYWGDYYPGAMAIALCTHGGYLAGKNAAAHAKA